MRVTRLLFMLSTISLLSLFNSCDRENSAEKGLLGSYWGVLPCADCEGIETELTLSEKNQYTLVTRYLGKEEEGTFSIMGSFKTTDTIVELLGIEKGVASPYYLIEESSLRHLDMDGKKVEGELEYFYILRKLGNPEVENRRWQLVELMGESVEGSGESHYLILHSEERRAEAKAGCNILSFPYRITSLYAIKFEHGISTLMACPDNVEEIFVQSIMAADNITFSDSTLSLNRARMAPLAIFKLVEELPKE